MPQEMTALDSCLAIIASICLNGSAEIELVRGWPWSGARITAANVTIASTLGTDNRQVPDDSQMEKLCATGKCFRYSRHCSVIMEETHCKYYYASDMSPYLREIEMTGPSMAEIEKSWSNIAFAPYPDLRIGFDRLTFDNGSDLPPIDRSRARR